MSNTPINFDNLTTFDAPLKTVSENVFRAANNYANGHNINFFGALNPHLYNRVGLIRTKFADAEGFTSGAGVFANITADANGQMTPIGTIKRYSAIENQFITEKYGDWCFYYELKPLKQYSWGSSSVPKNPAVYDTVEEIDTTYYYHITTSGTTGTTSTPSTGMGLKRWCVIGSPLSESDPPTPTHNYDEWLVVSAFNFYNREVGSTAARTAINQTVKNGVFPVVLWDIQNIYRYGRKPGKPYSGVVNGNFQGLTIFNPKIPATLARLWNWRYISTMLFEVNDVSEVIIKDQYKHTSNLGDDIKYLLPEAEIALGAWIKNSEETIYYNTIDLPALAFRNEDAFLKFLADWGITRVTNDKDDAQNKPAELFPGYTPEGDGFNPDGENPAGYDTNPTIPSIPSYPDNTSDRISPSTPNISAINAASVYALSLSGVKSLLNWLMSEDFTKNISELFSDKLSAIDDLKIMPFDIVNHDSLHALASDTLTVANVTGNVVCHKIQPNYNCIINGGSYHYTAYWGDYNDYTAATYYLYIPYGGIVELSPSFVVNRDLRLEYALDIMTGNATAVIYSNDVFVKTVPCQMGQTVPITYTNTNQREIKNALAALNAGNSLIQSAAKGDVLGAVLGVVNPLARTALTNPLQIGSIGNFSANTSLVMPQNPFLIISRTQQSIPDNMAGIIGKPSNTFNNISAFVGSGFVQISANHINTTATTAEQEQIISLLQSGIFI